MAVVQKSFRSFLNKHKSKKGHYVLRFKTEDIAYRSVLYPNIADNGVDIESFGGNVYPDTEESAEEPSGKCVMNKKGKGIFNANVEIGDNMYQVVLFPEIGDSDTVEFHSGPVNPCTYDEETGEITLLEKSAKT